jgi:hypothetical protein
MKASIDEFAKEFQKEREREEEERVKTKKERERGTERK